MAARCHFESFLGTESLLDGFPSASFVVDVALVEMRSFCLLASMELNLIPDYSLLYLHSNDINSFQSVFLREKVIE